MTIERRISEAFTAVDDFEPSVDLWARVNRSIEEDRAHRKRLRVITTLVSGGLLALFGIGWLFRVETSLGRMAVEWRAMEAIVTVALVLLVLSLGPAVRRFGDGYAGIIFRTNPETGERFIRLIDIAYYLVFAGYVLLTSEFEQPIESALGAGDQLRTGLARIGGLLVLMGVMHGAMFIVLPLVGLVFTATWHGRPLPRWINAVLILGGAAAAGAVLIGALVVLGIGAGG